MKDVNCVHLIGRLGQDPEVHSTDTGTARTTFSVATNRTSTTADGQMKTETEWTRCAAWSTLTEIGAQYLHKGSRVYVTSRLHTSRWEDVQTGEQRARVELVVDDLILLDRPMPAATPEDEQDAGEAERDPNTPAPTPRATAQEPIRRQPRALTRSLQMPGRPSPAPADQLAVENPDHATAKAPNGRADTWSTYDPRGRPRHRLQRCESSHLAIGSLLAYTDRRQYNKCWTKRSRDQCHKHARSLEHTYARIHSYA